MSTMMLKRRTKLRRPQLLKQGASNGGPIAYWDARRHDGGPILKDLASERHHLQMGSTHVARILPAPSAPMGLLLPGQAGRYASAPNRAEYGLTGDIDFIVHAQRNWFSEPGGYKTLVGSWVARYLFAVTAEGNPTLWLRGNDGNFYERRALATVVAPNGNEPLWLRCTFRASDKRVQFFQSSDGGSWTQIGTDYTSSIPVAVNNVPGAMEIGATEGGIANFFKGFIYRAIVKNGIDGTTVFDADFTKQAEGATTFTEDALGATVTINGTGSDTNEPLFLPLGLNEDPYLYLPGTAGNYVSTPDATALNVTGSIDIRFRAALASWASGAHQDIVTKWVGTNNSFVLRVQNDGILRLYWVDGGGTSRSLPATVTVMTAGAVNGEPLSVRATFDNSTGTVTFYTSLVDGGPWVQLGAPVTSPAAAGLGIKTSPGTPINIGAQNNGTILATGAIHWAQIRDGIDGTVVADFNPAESRQPHRTVIGSAGNVWTINRSATGRKATLVDAPMFLFGTDDYMEAPDHDDLDFGGSIRYTVIAAYRRHGSVPSNRTILSKKLSSAAWDPGYALRWGTAIPQLLNTTSAQDQASTASADIRSGDLHVLAGVRADSSLKAHLNTVVRNWVMVSSSMDSTANAQPLRIGAMAGSVSEAPDMEFIGAAIFRRALSDAEVAQVSREFGWTPHASLIDEAVLASVPAVQDSSAGLIDVTGRGHHFRIGSAVGADTNDPLLLPYDGEKYVDLPGTAGNYISTPDHPSFGITGDIDIRVRVALSDWTPSSYMALFSTMDGGAGGAALQVSNLGYLDLNVGIGSGYRSFVSTVIPGFTDGSTQWVRATLDVDNGAGGSTAKFFSSTNGVDWTQIGGDVVIAGAIAIQANNDLVTVGTRFDGFPAAGVFYEAELRDGIDGTVVASFNAEDAQSLNDTTIVSSATSEVWTINKSVGYPKAALRDSGRYVYLPGIAGNYISTPDSAALDITGDIDIRAKVALVDWSPAATRTLISKEQAYRLVIQTDGRMRFDHWIGGVVGTPTSGVLVVNDGDVQWVRATRVAATGTTSFFVSTDGSNWINRGDVVGTTGALDVTTTGLYVGALGGVSNFLDGNVYQAEVRNGIDGTLVADFNAGSAVEPYSTVVGGAGETWTFNRTATGKKLAVVDQNLLLFGTDDYAETPDDDEIDFGASDSFTALVLVRQFDFGGGETVIAKKIDAANAIGWYMRNGYGTPGQIFSATANGTAAVGGATDTRASGVRFAVGILRNVSALSATLDGVISSSVTSSYTVANSEALRLGRLSGSGTGYLNGEIMGVAIVRRALSAAELTQLSNELIAFNASQVKRLTPRSTLARR